MKNIILSLIISLQLILSNSVESFALRPMATAKVLAMAAKVSRVIPEIAYGERQPQKPARDFLKWVIPELADLKDKGYYIIEKTESKGRILTWIIMKDDEEAGLIRASIIKESVTFLKFHMPAELRGQYDTAIFSLFLTLQNRWSGYKFKVERAEDLALEMRKEIVRFNITFVNPSLRRSYIEGRVPYVEPWVFEPILKTGIFDKPGMRRLDDIGYPASNTMFGIVAAIESCA